MTRKLSQKEQMAYSTIARLEAERDQLQRDLIARDDQLAERDVLLRSLDDAWNSHDGKERFGALMFKVEEVVSASAEPSAPVERDERADFESWYVSWFNATCKPAKPATAESMKASRKGDDYGAGSLGKNGKWSGWQARAALARKA